MPEIDPTDPQKVLHLREITEDNLREVCNLSQTLSDAQRRMVADNSLSIAQGCYS